MDYEIWKPASDFSVGGDIEILENNVISRFGCSVPV